MAGDSALSIKLKVPGRQLPQPSLPRDLLPRLRGAASQADEFLPHGYVEAVATFDLSVTSRSAEGGAEEKDVRTEDGQVIALELQGGITVYTSPENLRATLARVAPGAIDAEGNLHIDGLRDRAVATRGAVGDGVTNLVSRLFTLVVGKTADPILEAAKKELARLVGEKADAKLKDYAQLGVSWLGTKALLWAIESRLPHQPGLYRWGVRLDATSKPLAKGDPSLVGDARNGPLLVFIHGTGSNTEGGFGDLQSASTDEWATLAAQYSGRVLAFEHYTLSESPIENAIQLAKALPRDARVHLVSHSRGGLVGDLLCLDRLADTEASLVDEYALDKVALGEADPAERARLKEQLTKVYELQREQLRELASLLATKNLRVERYVRVASPSRGTRLASGNLDVFLSGLLSLIGLVPALAGQPLYSAFKRVVLEVAKNRTKPSLVPGIEAMLPESPMARLLARATPQASVHLAVIAGDIEGGSLLKRLGVFFTDHVFFEAVQNDLVVDTDSMYAGVARPAQTRTRFEQGPDVNHFRYFKNASSRAALHGWLCAQDVTAVPGFEALRTVVGEPTGPAEAKAEEARRSVRGTEVSRLPVVVVLPGIMGSHLWRNEADRIWLDPIDLLKGGLAKIAWGKPNIDAEKIFSLYYGDVCEHLSRTHRVERFAYDWRQPLDVLAHRLAGFLRGLLADPTLSQLPIRLLAHSMGGLVVRALVQHAEHRPVWNQLMERTGARFVMLGTPNQGSHSMVEGLVGKSSLIRMLARADATHPLQEILDIVGGFPGGLQLLPKPGFKDTDQEASPDYFDRAFWSGIQPEMRDFWFGNGIAAVPDKRALDAGRWLWRQDGLGTPSLPPEHADRVSYVYGCARSTACGFAKTGERLLMLSTAQGDGTVTWASGKIGGIGSFYWMPAEHGSLADTKEYFESLAELLQHGSPGRLATSPPVTRDAAAAPPIPYDAGPPGYPSENDLAGGLIGAPKRVQVRSRALPTLRVAVKAMDLRGITKPILVGHYEQDAISGAESIIDREIVRGQLSVRYSLGLYAGPLGTSTIALVAANEAERRRGSRRGAIVTGLGPYDGSLGVVELTEAVRTAALRCLTHLMEIAEGAGDANGEVHLASLLLGYNSSVSLSIADSVTALVRGVAEANRKFAETTGSSLRIGSLEIVELYLDTAISAAYELVRLAGVLASDEQLGCKVEAASQLSQGEGVRIRLEDERGGAYWPRLHASDADRREDEGPGERGGAGGEVRPAAGGRMRFLFVGARARAEALLQQRQPGLVEKFVAQQITSLRTAPDFCRTLFQLLVPPDFKDVVRRMDRVVFVVDGYTANLPWELMQADELPIAVKSRMIRQLASSRFRRRVRQSVENRAYVVGNPSTEGFAKAFPKVPRANNKTDLESLEAAGVEASEVARLLGQEGIQVDNPMDHDSSAIDVINGLYQHPYRIVHVAAHGIFEECHADGRLRSGVVLSDGLLLTAAEIDAMEIVPDLVFLNCCHLAKTSPIPTEFNKLAYSVARELIEMGVRAVVVAGWAVEDEPGRHFATTFYEQLLSNGMEFGDAVFEARRSTHEKYEDSLTWGAFQAYGDPGWRFDPKRDPYRARRSRRKPDFVSPQELVQRLDGDRESIGRMDHEPSKEEASAKAGEVRETLGAVSADWLKRPDVCTALGRLHAELGPDHFESAQRYYETAIATDDTKWRAPIQAIEQLANLESRRGENTGDAELIHRAIARLGDLARVVLGKNLGATSAAELVTLNSERLALLGSAYKRLAAVYAKSVARGADDGAARKMQAAIRESAKFYGANAGDPTAPSASPYRLLNWLALVALDVPKNKRMTYAKIARRCAEKAHEDFRREPNVWSAVGPAEAAVVERLFDGGLGTPQEGAIVDDLARRYRDALSGVRVKPKDLDSILRQICLLALFHRAKTRGDDAAGRIANRLCALVNRLAPGTCDAAACPPEPPAASSKKEAGPRARRGEGRKRSKSG